jgi:hypothetical protein
VRFLLAAIFALLVLAVAGFALVRNDAPLIDKVWNLAHLIGGGLIGWALGRPPATTTTATQRSAEMIRARYWRGAAVHALTGLRSSRLTRRQMPSRSKRSSPNQRRCRRSGVFLAFDVGGAA